MAKEMRKKRQILGKLATEPGLAMVAAHVLLSAAAGVAALAVASCSFLAATTIKLLKETGRIDDMKPGRMKNFLEDVNSPLRIAGVGLAGLSALSIAGGLPLLGFAFAMFSGGNLLFNKPFTRKIPLDNVLYTAGSCTTAFIAGGSILPWLAIIPAGALSIYNLVKPSGDRNLGHPKFLFAASQGASAILGFASGQAERLLPSIAMMSVVWGYSLMEIRQSGWFEKPEEKSKIDESNQIEIGGQPSPNIKPSREISAPDIALRKNFSQTGNPADEPENLPPPSSKNMSGPKGPDMS